VTPLKPVNRLRLDPDQITIYRGHHVLITDRHGLVTSDGHGYYLRQTRFLSRFEIFNGDEKVGAVCCNGVEPHSTVGYYLMSTPAGRKAALPGGGEVVEKGIELQMSAAAIIRTSTSPTMRRASRTRPSAASSKGRDLGAAN
jgi:hypothetical protein